MLHFLFILNLRNLAFILHFYNPSQFRLAMFQMLNSLLCLVATVLHSWLKQLFPCNFSISQSLFLYHLFFCLMSMVLTPCSWANHITVHSVSFYISKWGGLGYVASAISYLLLPQFGGEANDRFFLWMISLLRLFLLATVCR